MGAGCEQLLDRGANHVRVVQGVDRQRGFLFFEPPGKRQGDLVTQHVLRDRAIVEAGAEAIDPLNADLQFPGVRSLQNARDQLLCLLPVHYSRPRQM